MLAADNFIVQRLLLAESNNLFLEIHKTFSSSCSTRVWGKGSLARASQGSMIHSSFFCLQLMKRNIFLIKTLVFRTSRRKFVRFMVQQILLCWEHTVMRQATRNIVSIFSKNISKNWNFRLILDSQIIFQFQESRALPFQSNCRLFDASLRGNNRTTRLTIR